MLTALGPWRLRSRGAHCDPELVKKIGEENWRRGLAKRLYEKVGEEDWRGEGEGGEEGRAALIKSSNPHLAGREKQIFFLPPLWKQFNLGFILVASE